jgi:hypothetical protein
LKEVPVFARQIGLVLGFLWTLLNSFAIRGGFVYDERVSNGSLWRYGLALAFFTLWAQTSATVLGLIIYHDLRATLRHEIVDCASKATPRVQGDANV